MTTDWDHPRPARRHRLACAYCGSGVESALQCAGCGARAPAIRSAFDPFRGVDFTSSTSDTILGALATAWRRIRASFAWRLVGESAVWAYWENTITGERSISRKSAGYQPRREAWLAGGAWDAPIPRPPGPVPRK